MAWLLTTFHSFLFFLLFFLFSFVGLVVAQGKTNTLKVVEMGEDGLEELAGELNASQLQVR